MVADAALKKARINARKEWDNAADGWRKYVPEYGVSEETLKGHIGEMHNYAFLGTNDREKAAIAIGLYESLLLDLSRTVAARILQARALEQSGKLAKATEVLEEQQRDLGSWESNGHLEKLKQFARRNPAFRKGWPYTRPETISWL